MARKPDVPLRNGTAGGFSGQPPRNNQRVRSRNPPGGLTPKFNQSANPKQAIKPPASKEQIQELRAKISRRALTFDRTPLGTIRGSYKPESDRKIENQIKAIQKALHKKNDMARKAFQKATLKSSAKKSFNQAASRKM